LNAINAICENNVPIAKGRRLIKYMSTQRELRKEYFLSLDTNGWEISLDNI
jgi:hypothetical protein